MKRPLLTILLSLWIVSAFSQQLNSLTLSIGPAFPVGEFANKDPYDPASGLAEPGFLLDVSYYHKTPNTNFGVTASLRARVNSMDTKAMLRLFMDKYPGYNWSVDKKPWKTAAAMVGAYHHAQVAKTLYLREALMFGAAEALLPNTTVTGLKDTSQTVEDLLQATTKEKYATTFSALLKIEAAHPLTSRLSLMASLDFWYLKPTFTGLTQKVIIASGFPIPGNYSLSTATAISLYQSTTNYIQAMSSIDLSVGLLLQL